MFNRIKRAVRDEIKNVPGRKISRKLVVLFADDYGSVRTRDKNALENLVSNGVPMDQDYFSHYDTLCSNRDLEALFEVLTSFRDAEGNYAVMSPMAIMGNPDFMAIRENGYQNYVWESFDVTLKKYGSSHNNVFTLWKQGIKEGIFHPSFHGVEHISSNMLMYGLKNGHKSTRLAFDMDCVGVPCLSNEKRLRVMSTYIVNPSFNNSLIDKGIEVGIKEFEAKLGYKPTVFTPAAGNQTLHHNKVLYANGIRYICVGRKTIYPKNEGGTEVRYYYNGAKEENGMMVFVKNCVFEPRGASGTASAEDCLKQIESAFRWHNPALISSHRANFSGEIDEKNRRNSLKQLSYLYQEIVKRWPDALFVNADELANYMSYD